MTCAKRDEPLGSDLHAVIHKIEADILQNTKKRNQKWIVLYHGSFSRNIPATKASFAPK